ncbi:unnamed protein product, partial [Ectocarpus sp. 12 AP-2014]
PTEARLGTHERAHHHPIEAISRSAPEVQCFLLNQADDNAFPPADTSQHEA